MATVPKLQIYQQEDKLAHYGILLLGTEAAGKSTIIKQMRILHGNGFSHQEKKQIITNIKENIMDAILVISHAMTILTPTVTLQHPENNTKIEYLQKQTRQFNYDYPPEFFENITALWRDEGIQATYQRKNEYQLIDNAKYFFDKIDVIKHTDYIPTEQDILNCYQKFENNYENCFQINNIMFDMFDIRRIRWERRRYLHYLNGTITLVYVVASDSYDTVLSEFDYTTKQNRLKESLYLFETIWKIRWYLTTSVILFLNKQDLFCEKILTGKSKLEEHFPDFSDYKAPLNVQFQSSEHPEVTRAKYFIRDQFLNIFTASTNKFQFCYPHFTCAIDTENIKQVFNDCYNIIQYLNLCGFNIL